MIDYVTIVPAEDDKVKGHKFPFNACEILCSENGFILDKLVEKTEVVDDDEDSEDSDSSANIPLKETEGEIESVTQSVESITIEDEGEKPKEEKIEKEEKEEKNEKEEKDDKDDITIEHDNSEIKHKEEYSYDILDYLYRFLETDEIDMNYVLAGYFTKIFNHLMNIKSNLMVKYIFQQRQDVIDHLVKHINRRAITECVQRLLVAYTEEITNGTEFKRNIVDKLFTHIERNELDLDEISNITDTIIESLSNRKFYSIFKAHPELLEKLYSVIKSQLSNKDVSRELIKIITKINENLRKKQFIKIFQKTRPHRNNR